MNPTKAHRATHREQMKKDDKVIFLIHQCVDSNVLEKIIDYEMTKEAWDVLATTYAGDKQTKKVRLMALRRQLGLLQMESNEMVAKFVNRLVILANQMKSCGEVVTDSMKVEKVLAGLTPNIDHIVSAIEQSKDLETLKLEQLLGSLEAHELKMKNTEGIKKEEKAFEKALFAKNQKKGGGDSWKNKKGKDECSNPKVPRKRGKEAQPTRDSNDEEAVMLMATVNSETCIEEEWWYLDTGCSNHMTGHKDWFYEIDETVKRNIKFGDGRSVMAKGIGKVAIRRVDGSKVTISDVLYVPNVESNLLSLGQLLEKGFSMHMEGEHMEVVDSNGKCVLKVVVSKNRTFKVGVSTIEQKCLTAQSNDSVWKWHRRLGHLNFNSLNKLQKKNMVVGLPLIKVPRQVCGRCCEGK
ncbi:uncharacterized protein [Glycine max]|uniref:uncharacterized protein n=1 Tax=Glycine max TaxID=3847 RepID=UPI0007194523|nr:uncharacterized protein LOC106796133 [Glycine max]|eukprot:XP_014623180.1 uncharacterized protein LOC106796133 [Glycine max]